MPCEVSCGIANNNAAEQGNCCTYYNCQVIYQQNPSELKFDWVKKRCD